MLFGQSVFQSVLDRLDAEEEEAPKSAEPSAHRILGLNTGFASTVLEGVSVPSARPDQAYVDNLGSDGPFAGSQEEAATEQDPVTDVQAAVQEPSLPEPPVMPQHLTRIRPEQIAAELSISSKDTLHSLSDKRRSFAKANHPDGVAPPFRDNATTRMKVANLLIDEAMRRLAKVAKLAR
jgi:hypothetical protein